MTQRPFDFLLGTLSSVLLTLNTVFWCTPLLTLSVLKLLLPVAALRRRIDPVLNTIAAQWIACNSAWIGWLQRHHPWRVDIEGTLRPGGWYLVNCNHRSWVDIFVLQKVFNRRIPMLKFFLKQQLIWVPVIGLAWWALDFPFMRRHSEAQLKKNPALREQDRQTTRRSCERFALVPTSVMNFAEGTRLTDAKHAAQQSPYEHLLKPKAGALALALNAMGHQFQALLDVTVVYLDGTPSYWDLACGRMGRVALHVMERPIPTHLVDGDYGGDAAFRAEFQAWLGEIWTEKDRRIAAMLMAR
ncbi:MAG: acyltransferase [Inhella sp.]|uniref:acyltransferase n=1 Tax=Inhella sp. TaxID=1921806 RepID=UPI0022C962D3|nr:acyltransferase [Inhella sp.]MCZ8235382.1 acyltransferase [Inhella sp.]